jgi:hypothetical protein
VGQVRDFEHPLLHLLLNTRELHFKRLDLIWNRARFGEHS